MACTLQITLLFALKTNASDKDLFFMLCKYLSIAKDKVIREKISVNKETSESDGCVEKIVRKAMSNVMDESLCIENKEVFFTRARIPSQSQADSVSVPLSPDMKNLPRQFTEMRSVPPVYSYLMNNGYLQGNTFFCCDADNPNASSNRLYMSNESLVLKYSKSTERLKTDEDCVYVVGVNIGYRVFFHWLYQCMAAMLHSREVLSARNIKHKFVVPELSSWQKKSLEIVGIHSEDCITLTDDQYLLGAKIFYTNLLSGAFVFAPSEVVFEAISGYRQKCLLKTSSKRNTRKGLYISREGVAKRKLENEEKLSQELSKLGFEIVVMTEYSLEEQVELFAFADFIIAPHGSALTSLMFCSPGTYLLEIMPENYMNSCFYSLAQHMKMSYELVVSRVEIENGRHHSTSSVDIEKVLELAKARLSPSQSSSDFAA